MTDSEVNHNSLCYSGQQNGRNSNGLTTCLSENDKQSQKKTSTVNMYLQGKDLKEFPTLATSQEQCIIQLYLDYNTIECIPETVFSTLDNLVIFSIIGNDVDHLPSSIGRLIHLEALYLNENEISFLPDTISKLSKLKELNIVGNKIKSLPNIFGCLSNLQQLYAHENLIEELPDSFPRLSQLHLLELSDNKLQTLPEDFGNLSKLENLNLSGNKLTTLPKSFGELPQIKKLDLSENSLQCLPATFTSAAVLEKFFFEQNYVVWWPDWMGCMPCLQELSAEDNRLTGDVIPEEFGRLCGQLRVLNLAGNYISHLPDSIGSLSNLETLHMGSCIDELERRAYQNGNRLVNLPNSFCQLSKLRHVRLDENKLERLPERVGELLSLEHLDLGQNHLQELPTSFCDLRSLVRCQLSRNQLEQLPDRMDQMTSLRSLKLDNNLITSLPGSLGELIQLETLDLFHNRLTAVPTFLHQLTGLRQLDLLENNFKLKLKEIPRVHTSVKYPFRDPNLKCNWRGRVVVAHKPENEELEEDGMDDEEQSSDSEPEFTENQLELAMRHNLSLWRSHTGPAVREKFTQPEPASRSRSTTLPDSVHPSQSSIGSQPSLFWKGSDVIEGHGAATWCSELKYGEESWDEDLTTLPVGQNEVTQIRGMGNDPWGSVEELDEDGLTKGLKQLSTENDCDDPRYRFVPCEAHPSDLDRAARAPSEPEDGQFDDADDVPDC